MNTLLFVYGTLKQGCSNHAQMDGQTLVGAARTIPGFALYDLGGYPTLVAEPTDQEGVLGEVWSVDAVALARLDRFEGVHEGLYSRRPISLRTPFADVRVETYVSPLGASGRPRIGSLWRE